MRLGRAYHGFTLIELLVVVTIIVVLLSLLTPSLDQAIAAAERALCMSNQRQVGMGLGYYHGDNKRAFPWGFDLPPDQILYPYSGSEPGWDNARPPQQQLRPYLANSTKVFRCPTDNGKPAAYLWWQYDPDQQARDAGSSYMFSERGLYGQYKVLTTRNVVNPATWGYMSEGFALPNGWTWLYSDPEDPSRPTSNPPRITWSHVGTVNFLYGDLHVANVPQWSPELGGLKDRVREQPFNETLPQ